MTKREDVKPGKKLKMAAGLVASAAAGTIAAMAYKVNEDKINAGIDKAADVTKNVIGKVSEKVKEAADSIVDMADEEKAAPEGVEPVVVDVEACGCSCEEAGCGCECESPEAEPENEKTEV